MKKFLLALPFTFCILHFAFAQDPLTIKDSIVLKAPADSAPINFMTRYGPIRFIANPSGTPSMMLSPNGTIGIGIGTKTPTSQLSVSTADFGNVGIGKPATTNSLSVAGNSDVSGNLNVGALTSTDRLSVAGTADISGNVNIGTASAKTKLEVSGNIKAESIEANTAKGNIARRDWRPYGKSSFFWDGGIENGDVILTRLSKKGASTITSEHATNPWNNKRMITFNGLSQESATTTTPPANGIYITLPATPGVHNSLLISTIDADRWSVWSVWLCNADKSKCIKLAVSSNNANGAGTPSTYTLSPRNTFKETGGHAWMTFPVSDSLVKEYLDAGNLTFLVTSGAHNDNGAILYLSGLALVPNPNGFMQQPAVTLIWGLNGNQDNKNVTWLNVWPDNNDGLAYVSNNSSASVFIKVVDPSKDMLVTFYEHNNNWHGGTLNVRVGNDPTVFNPSPGIISMASTLYSSTPHMRPESIIIPAEIIQRQLIANNSAGVLNTIMLNLENKGGNNFYFRGIDTEIY